MNKQKILAIWDTADMIDNEIKYELENWEHDYADRYDFEKKPSEEELREALYMDDYLFQDAWDMMLDDVQYILNKKNPNGTYWKATVKGFGWRNLDGYKYFKAKDAETFLQELLPETDCTFYIYNNGKGLKVHNFHHDSPTGEWYYIRPVAESTYYKFA